MAVTERLMLQTPPTEDNAGAAYQQVAENRAANTIAEEFRMLLEGGDTATPAPAGGGAPSPSGNPDFDALMQGGETAPAPQASQGEVTAPEAKTKEAPAPVDEGDDLASKVATWAKRIGKDVAGGAVEAPGQVVGGVIDALGEMDQFMQQVLPIGGVQLFDEQGNFDVSILSHDEMMASNKAGEDIFTMIAPEKADTVTGSFARATAQFLTAFIPGMQATKGMTALKGGTILSSMVSGAIADMVVFDPNEDRLSTYLNQIPALANIVPDYLADNNPDQSHWEGRFKNAIEGLGIGAATDGLLSAFKYYKAARKAKAANRAAQDPIGATVEAAKDELKAIARVELVQDIPDDALRPLGDAALDAPLLVEAPANETTRDAFTRISEARTRAAKNEANKIALEKISASIDRFSSPKNVAVMLDGKKIPIAKGSKLPEKGLVVANMYSDGKVYIGKPGELHFSLHERYPHSQRGDATFDGFVNPDGQLLSRSEALEWVDANEKKIRVDSNMLATHGRELDAADYREQVAKDKRAGRTAPPSREPLDEMLDELRSGAVSNAKIPKRPISEIVKGLGGIDPTSSLAADMRSRGITAKAFPGLYKRGGRAALDNVPASEHSIFAGRATPDAAGYIDQQSFIDGLEAELKGEPWMTAETQKTFDDIISPLDDLEVELDQMGIDYRTMSNERIKERVKEIQDADAIEGRDLGLDAPSEGRSLADIEKEAREEAIAQGRDPDIAAADAVKPKIYINHARITSADDVRATLQQMADLDADAINAKRRGVVTNEQTIKESSQEYRDLNDLIGRAPGPMNAAQAVAARRLLASSGEQIVQLAKIAQSPGATPADLYNFRRAMSVHYAIQSEVVAARTETARALQAWAIPAGATKARSQAVSELIMQSGGAGDIQALAKAVSTVGNNPTAINTMARELGRGRFGKALYQVWINGLLSSPKTHAVNILSNAMTSLYAIPERYMAAGISKAFYNGEVAAGEAASQAFGLVKGIRDGVRLVYMGNKADGMAGLSDVFDAFGKVDGVQQNAFSADALGLDPAGSFGYGIDMLGKLVNAPGSALNAEDKFFKTIAYRMELHAQAYRQAAAEGLDGKDAASRIQDILSNPPDTLKAEALDMAHYQTFTTPLSGSARQALGGIQKNAFIGPVFRVVVPFVRTPTNIMKYTFERTPLAYLSGGIRADIRAGGARAAQAHARVALGSMIMLSVMDMAAEGTITGAGPLASDSGNTGNLRRTQQGAGAPPPYSVKIGDRWYSYSRLDPIGMLIGLGADMSSIAGDAEEADSDYLAAAGVVAVAQNLASKTYLSGVFDFMAAIDPNNPTSDPGKYLSNLTGGLVPFSSFSRNLAAANDPIARDAKTVVYGEDLKIDPVASYLQSTIDKIKRGIPGLSDTLPPMRDLWGEPINRASGLGWAWDFVSPVASRADNPDPVTQAIIDNRIQISFPPRNIEGVQLTAQEYDQFSELAGKGAKEYLDQLVASPSFKQMSDGPDGMKAEIIKNVINNFRDQARQEMMMRNPELRDRAIFLQRENMRSLTGQ